MGHHGKDQLRHIAPRTWLWLAIVVGTVARLVVAFTVTHFNNDITSYLLVSRALRHDALNVYAQVGPTHWPYGPVFFPWTLAASTLANHTGVSFATLIKLPAIAADAVLAVLIYDELLRERRQPWVALAGGCLVALGPTFGINSALHGQIDSLAILPAVGALIVWRRMANPALAAGLLIGLATAIKTPAGLVLLALLLACRSRREATILVVAAVGMFAILMAPFAATDPSAVKHALTFTDTFGVGGLPVVLYSELHWSYGVRAVLDHRALITAVALLVTAALLYRGRERSPAMAASVLWLAFYSVGTGFFFGYLVWGIPFFLLAGSLWGSAALMALVLVPTLMFETGHIAGHQGLYAAWMTVVWATFAIACLWCCWRLVSRTPPSAPARGVVADRPAVEGRSS